jgi:hypothetical protein
VGDDERLRENAVKNALIIAGVAVLALLVAAAALWLRRAMTVPAAAAMAAPDGDLVAMDGQARPPKADAAVRVILPADAGGGGAAVAVVRARVYAPGSNFDKEMDIMLAPGTWAAP